MNKLILNTFHGKLLEAVTAKLEGDLDAETYLTNLSELYSKTRKLGEQLEKYQSESDTAFIQTLINSLFKRYLDSYPKHEERFIVTQCSAILENFYESKGHQKRALVSGGLQDFKRDLQARLLTVENFGGETFLSSDVAISIIQEFKVAFARCNLICRRQEAVTMNERLFDCLLKYLYAEHVVYAVELGLTGIPLTETKTEPPTHFLTLVNQTAAITYLYVRQFDDFFPAVKNTFVEDAVIRKRDEALRSVESRINLGLNRQINALVMHVKWLLSSEQKKSDFKPEDENGVIRTQSHACSLVVKYVTRMHACIRGDGVDGANLTTLLTEFALRLYTTIVNHIKSFSYNVTGSMLLVCDVNEYKKCVADWKIAEVRAKFEALHALVNLMVVVPDKLADAAAAPELISVDQSLMHAFVALRQDAKVAKFYLAS